MSINYWLSFLCDSKVSFRSCTMYTTYYKCRQLKNIGKIHFKWSWNNSANVKHNERSQPTKIHHVIDIEKLTGVDNLDKFINNTSF